jgi:hypothetical protein
MKNICDLSNEELNSHKKEIYDSLIEFGAELPNTILKKSLRYSFRN